MALYLYSNSHQETYGPYEPDQVKSMLAAGAIQALDYIAEEGEEWRTVRDWMYQSGAHASQRKNGKGRGKKDRPVRGPARASRKPRSHRGRRAGLPEAGRRWVSGIQFIILIILLAALGGAAWLYLKSEDKPVNSVIPALDGAGVDGGAAGAEPGAAE